MSGLLGIIAILLTFLIVWTARESDAKFDAIATHLDCEWHKPEGFVYDRLVCPAPTP